MVTLIDPDHRPWCLESCQRHVWQKGTALLAPHQPLRQPLVKFFESFTARSDGSHRSCGSTKREVIDAIGTP